LPNHMLNSFLLPHWRGNLFLGFPLLLYSQLHPRHLLHPCPQELGVQALWESGSSITALLCAGQTTSAFNYLHRCFSSLGWKIESNI
jgi:hypothetical protein